MIEDRQTTRRPVQRDLRWPFWHLRFAAGFVALGAVPKNDSKRTNWTADAGNTFSRSPNGTWIEVNLQGLKSEFKFVTARPTITSNCSMPSRKIAVRLFEDRCQVRVGDGEFKPFRTGHWETSSKAPGCNARRPVRRQPRRRRRWRRPHVLPAIQAAMWCD